MKIRSIRATEVFSFPKLELTLDDALTVLVGPNGAGKTNIVRLLDIARTSVRWHATGEVAARVRLDGFRSARRIGADRSAMSTIEVEIDFDQPAEHDLILSFVRVAATTVIQRDSPTRELLAELLPWTQREITEAKLTEMFHGRLVVEIPRERIDEWDAYYRFSCGGVDYDIPLGSDYILLATDPRSKNGTRSHSLVGAPNPARTTWKASETWELAKAMPQAGESTDLKAYMDQSVDASEIMRHLIRAAGINTDGGRRDFDYRFARALDRMLTRSLVLGPELRGAADGVYSINDLADEPEFKAERVPVALLRLKVGDLDSRARYAAIQTIFEDITHRRFDVQSMPPAVADKDHPTAIALVTLFGDDGEVPLEFSGAGAWEALIISALLDGVAGRTVVLDEPALNLHPSAQMRVLSKLNRLRNSQFLVITHSPYLVPAESGSELTRIVRIEQEDAVSATHRLDVDGLTDEDATVKTIGESADVRSLLFASGVILVEGGTELGALPVWLANSPTAGRLGTPEDFNIALFDVGGDSRFGTFVELLHCFHIPWVVLCDGYALRQTDREQQPGAQILLQVAKRCGRTGLIDQVRAWKEPKKPRPTFEQIKATASEYGVFSLAEAPTAKLESFEAFLEHVDPLLKAEAEGNGRKRRKPLVGRYFVYKHPECPPEIDALYASFLETLRLGSTANP
jgi:predicted ATPase